MSWSRVWKFVKSLARSLDATFSPLRISWIAKLHCGCIMTELVNQQLTKTYVEFSRSPTCKRSSHFTGDESGWPQIADAVRATILHSDASCGSCDALSVTARLQEARRQDRWFNEPQRVYTSEEP